MTENTQTTWLQRNIRQIQMRLILVMFGLVGVGVGFALQDGGRPLVWFIAGVLLILAVCPDEWEGL